MNFSHSINLASAAATVICSLAIGQQATERETRRQDDRQQVKAEASTDLLLTQYLAGKLILMNYSTIHMSQMARQHASSQEVQQFADKLAQSHQQLNEELRNFAPQIAEMATLKQGEQRTAAFRGATATSSSDDHHAEAAELLSRILQCDRKATENYLKSSSQMLEQYDGQEFDMGFLGFQIGAHTWALAELNAIEGTGDEQFQQIVEQATSTVKQNLQQARKLAKQLEDDRR
ncbi:MAG: DUF4142 domain-containing protein [Planctomycetaceae bacterium]|nr:DUF4142 domain-containing protein [Planctomycetaceae bacterium]